MSVSFSPFSTDDDELEDTVMARAGALIDPRFVLLVYGAEWGGCGVCMCVCMCANECVCVCVCVCICLAAAC